MRDYFNSLPKEDSLTIELSALYEKYGYKKYCMAKFEEYSLYSDYRDFLSSDGVIAFNNSDGKLMALKPDITLSIVKNVKIDSVANTKCYYNENVYRMAGAGHDYKEIKQSGIEMLGKIDAYSTAEVLMLALQSLEKIDTDCVLTVSHMAFVTALTQRIDASGSVKKQIKHCIAEKNAHDLAKLCEENGVSADIKDKLGRLMNISGSLADVLPQLRKEADCDCAKAACDELEQLCKYLSHTASGKVCFDLAVLSQSDYYTGIIFQGYAKQAPRAVLSGGRYDKLAGKIRKNVEAIGFAVYLDGLNLYYRRNDAYDADVLVLFDGKDDACGLLDLVKTLTESGNSVRVDSAVPPHFKAQKVLSYENGCVKEVEEC